jgi:hypothetical protein
MAAFANAAIVALLAAPTFATEVQQHIQDGPAIYKVSYAMLDTRDMCQICAFF